MNLSEFIKLDNSAGEFIKFKKTGEVRYLRFLYTSGGNTIGSDMEVIDKLWNEEAGKYEYNTGKGNKVVYLKCIEYDKDGSNPRLVKWERSAYFCKAKLIPLWSKYPRIIDSVWEITASNPTTQDAEYTIFPVINADTIKYPLIDETPVETKPANATDTDSSEDTATAEEAPKRKKYWEDD